MDARICFDFEMLVEACELYSKSWDEHVWEENEEALEVWDMLLLGLSTDVLHSEMGNVLMVPFLQFVPDKLKERFQKLVGHRDTFLNESSMK